MNVHAIHSSELHEDDQGLFAEASSLGRKFARSAWDSAGATYRCEDGRAPEKITVFND